MPMSIIIRYTPSDESSEKPGSVCICTMSCSMLNCRILASMQLNRSAMGNQRYTCIYRHIHPVSVLWNPS